MSGACGSARRTLWDVSGPQPFTPHRVSAQSHVERCASCRAFFEENERLARLVRDAAFVRAPADVRERVFERVATQRAGRLRPLPPTYVAAVAAVLLVTVAGLWGIATRGPAAGQVESLAADHARATADERLESEDAREVEAWLAARVGYGVFVPTLSTARVVGGRVAVTDLGRSAVVEYDAHGQRVSYFIVETPSAVGTAAAEGVELGAAKGYTVARWRDRGLLHAFVGNVSPAQLQKMAHECIEQARASVQAGWPRGFRMINT